MMLTNDALSLQTHFPTSDSQVKNQSETPSSASSTTSSSEEQSPAQNNIDQDLPLSPKSDSSSTRSRTAGTCSPNSNQTSNIDASSQPPSITTVFEFLSNLKGEYSENNQESLPAAENQMDTSASLNNNTSIKDFSSNPSLLQSQVGNNQNIFHPILNDPNSCLQLQQMFNAASPANIFSSSFPTLPSATNIFSQNTKKNEASSRSRRQGSTENPRKYPVSFQWCELCKKNIHSSKLPCHIRQVHIAKPMFRCPECDFTSTYSKNNVKSHIVSLHNISVEPQNFMAEYSNLVEEYMKQCFPRVRGRGRPVHPGRTSPKSPQNKRNTSQQVEVPQSFPTPFPASVYQNGNRQENEVINRINLANAQRFPLGNQGMPPPFGSNHANWPNTVQAMHNNNAAFIMANPQFFPLLNMAKQDNPMLQMSNSNVFSPLTPVKHSTSPEVSSLFNGASTLSVQDLLNSLKKHQEMSEENNNTTVENKEEVKSILVMDNLVPKYFNNEKSWKLLDGKKIKNTVFEMITENSNALIENVDFSQYNINSQQLIGANYLTSAQAAKVAETISTIKLQPFEIMFALHRFDLAVINRESVKLVYQIAPTNVDIERFKKIEANHLTSGMLAEAEQFVLQLAKIERLEDKLFVMHFISTFEDNCQTLKNDFKSLINICNGLVENQDLKVIIHLLLVFFNMVNLGSCNNGKMVVSGFTLDTINNIGQLNLNDKGLTVFEGLKQHISQNYSLKLAIDDLADKLDETQSINCESLVSRIKKFEAGLNKTMSEQANVAEGSIIILTDFVDSAKDKLRDLNEIREMAEQATQNCAKYFCANLEYMHFSTLTFFTQLLTFVKNLKI
uniref:FH2 domain-containing protein n=1 Tax=Rhabditophanes sp. KR3021 TaxID=114890 RepID=A0AC35UAT1_9BILA